MVQPPKPTRSELINLRKKIKLAVNGYKLLKKKRDGLIMELFDNLKKAKNLRNELNESYAEAWKTLAKGRATESDLVLESTALAVHHTPQVGVTTRNIMGVVVPKISSNELRSTLKERGYGLIGTTARIDETAKAYEDVVEKAVLVAEAETTLKKLLEEIEKTKRKVNALEQKIIPEQEKQAKLIMLRLEEMERDNFSRLKLIKQGLTA